MVVVVQVSEEIILIEEVEEDFTAVEERIVVETTGKEVEEVVTIEKTV